MDTVRVGDQDLGLALPRAGFQILQIADPDLLAGDVGQ